MDNLPIELLTSIMKELGVADLCRLRRVCKRLSHVLGDTQLQRRVLDDEHLSTKRPLLHAQALYAGRPHSMRTIEVNGVVGLEGSCLILKDSPRTFDLRTGLIEELDKRWEGCLVPKGVVLRAADATASFGDNVCQWTREGFFYITPEKALHRRTVVREFDDHLALLDDRYAWLFCFSWEMWLVRVRLSDLRFDSFGFYDDGHYPRQPVLKPAGDSWLLTTSTLQGIRCSILQLGDAVTLTRIGIAQAFLRGVPYTIDAFATGSATELFINDSFLVACREGSVEAYAFDPDVPGNPIKASRRQKKPWTAREVEVTHRPDENRPMVMLGNLQCLYVDLD